MLQRMQMKYKHETEFLEDNIALSGFTPFTSKLFPVKRNISIQMMS